MSTQIVDESVSRMKFASSEYLSSRDVPQSDLPFPIEAFNSSCFIRAPASPLHT
jgi:hypothetical protein